MPQILRQCGIERFVTQKLSWNQFTRPPHDSFRWRGIDGSEVLAHLPPVGTYNAELEPDELRRAVAAFRDHDRSDASLILFGHGDGGGGPTPEMLESAARVADLRGLPLVERSTAERFFDAVAERADELATISGQLYFEYHRGTYTSQSQTKLGNRAGERALHEAEAAAAIAWARGVAAYPAARARGAVARAAAQPVPRHPPRAPRCGEVHETAEAEQRSVREAATGLRDRATAALGGSRRPGTVRRSTSTGSSAATCSRRRRAGWRCTRARRLASAPRSSPRARSVSSATAISSGSTTASCPPSSTAAGAC